MLQAWLEQEQGLSEYLIPPVVTQQGNRAPLFPSRASLKQAVIVFRGDVANTNPTITSVTPNPFDTDIRIGMAIVGTNLTSTVLSWTATTITCNDNASGNATQALYTASG